MSREERIKELLKAQFSPTKLNLENESHTHNVPKGSETHFKLEMVSGVFEGLTRVQRQQKVMSELKHEFNSGLHALSMRLKTPMEDLGLDFENFVSPPCLGGSKKD